MLFNFSFIRSSYFDATLFYGSGHNNNNIISNLTNLLSQLDENDTTLQEMFREFKHRLEVLILAKNRSTYSIPEWPIDKELYQRFLLSQSNCSYSLSFSFDLSGGTRQHICFFVESYHAILLNRSYLSFPYLPRERLVWEEFFEYPAGLPKGCTCPFPTDNAQFFNENRNLEILRDNDRTGIPHVWAEGTSCPGEHLMSTENKIAMAAILWRLNPWAKAKVEELLAPFTNWNSRVFYAIHIRRGDKVSGPAKEAEYIPTERYCSKLEKVVGEIKYPVFVAADSVQTIYEVIQARPNWEVWYVDHPEFKKIRLGEFTHSHITQAPIATKKTWQILFQAEIVMMRFAKIFVGSGKTNVFTLMAHLRGNSVDLKRNYFDEIDALL